MGFGYDLVSVLLSPSGHDTSTYMVVGTMTSHGPYSIPVNALQMPYVGCQPFYRKHGRCYH